MRFGRLGSRRRGSALTPIPVDFALGQSWDPWARGNINELPLVPPNDGNTLIWNVATQTLVPLVTGPLTGGGNEQQPSNAFIDSGFQSGIGWNWTQLQEIRAGGYTGPRVKFVFAVGGSGYSDSSTAFGRAANWTPGLSGGAYESMFNNYTPFVAAMAALGYSPSPTGLLTDLGMSDAIYTSTIANAFEANHTAMIARLRTDGVLGANTPVFQQRLSNKLTLTFQNTIRTAHHNMAGANPTKYILINGDGAELESDVSHPTSRYIAGLGKRVAFAELGIAHPLTNIQELGATIYALRDWEFGGYPSILANSNTQLQTAWDNAGNSNLSQGTPTSRPTITESTLANGLKRRGGAFDADDWLFDATAPLLNRSGGFIVTGVFSGPIVNNGTFFGEYNAGAANPFWRLTTDATGKLCISLRDNGGAVPLAQADLGVGTAFGNGIHSFSLSYDGTQFIATLDGVTGAAVAYVLGSVPLTNTGVGALAPGGGAGALFYNGLNIYRLSAFSCDAAGRAAHVAAMRTLHQREYNTP